MDGRAETERNDRKPDGAQSYKQQLYVELHDHLHPERIPQIKDKTIFHNISIT